MWLKAVSYGFVAWMGWSVQCLCNNKQVLRHAFGLYKVDVTYLHSKALAIDFSNICAAFHNALDASGRLRLALEEAVGTVR
jgi:hypothetical protein